jgi:N-succinyldiaminopimelate aminotransferase
MNGTMRSIAAERTTSIGTSIFATMSRLAADYQAVNLGQGFPDFDGPSWLRREALAAMEAGYNQYAPMIGIRSLRESIAWYQHEYYDLQWNPEEEITITAGATEALFSAMVALLNPGDEVVLFEPYYDSYHANALLAGAVPVCVTLHRPDFSLDIAALERAITPRTRMVILNTPHNPTGRVFTHEELADLATVVQQHDLLVLSDEVYEFLVYDGSIHIPFASLPGMRERTVTVSSTGKTFGMTGWKIGYSLAPSALTSAIRKVHQFVTFAVNTPAQHAMAHALRNLPEYVPTFRTQYEARRAQMLEGLQHSVFTPHEPQGSYFVMVDIPPSLQEEDVACATRLVKEFGVATIPPSVFYSHSDEGKRMLRLCFAKKDYTITEGLRRLQLARQFSGPSLRADR